MYWRITEDLLADDIINLAGIQAGTVSNETLIQFRLLDGDRVPYYVGVAENEESVLAALDWAISFSGCVTAQTRQVSPWEDLN